MKHLLTILMLFVSISAFTQSFGNHVVGAKNKDTKDSTKVVKWYDDDYTSTISTRNNTPGQCLIAASNSQFAAYTFYAISSAIVFASTNDDLTVEQRKNYTALALTSGAVAIIFQVRATVMIGKAGRLLNEQQKSLTFKASPTGVGLALNF